MRERFGNAIADKVDPVTMDIDTPFMDGLLNYMTRFYILHPERLRGRICG